MTEATLEIEVTNIRNTKGHIILSFYKDQISFEEESNPFLKKVYSKSKVINGSLNIKIDLPEGRYGIVILDDENSDGEMKYNMIGMPKEGYGFSNFCHKRMSKPKLSDFDFIHNSKSIKVLIKITYR